MKYLVIIIIILFISWAQQICPQFAPLNLGNVWIGLNADGTIFKDTVTDTNYFFNNHIYSVIGDTSNGYFERFRQEDSLFVEYFASGTQNNHKTPFYKYNAALGDTWSYDINGHARAVFNIVGEYPAIVFNIPVQIKQLYVDIGGLVGRRELWTDEFGLLWGQETEGGEVFFRLKACVINGVVYGDTTTAINDIISSASNFNLYQNYPNPFNPNTIISYSLPSASKIKLIVYNALGQTVKLLENSYKQPGNYSVSFNASALPSGIYFYKLEAGQFTQVKKMILIK
jgi:hypothetical protein